MVGSLARKLLQRMIYSEVSYAADHQSSSNTTFKKVFKFYKQRAAKPDLSRVLDVRASNSHLGILCSRLDVSHLNEAELSFAKDHPGLRSLDEWTVSVLLHRPGLYILSNVITRAYQLDWIEKCLLHYPEPPNVTNLSTLGAYKGENVFLNNNEKLRWVTMGNHYNWSEKVYAERPAQALPSEIINVAKLISKTLKLGDMHADAVIINYYPDKATLSPHVDRSERDLKKPLISLNFGQSAIYLTGGRSLDDPVDALMLHSGDVLVMHDEQRLVYHGVPRILRTTRFNADESERRCAAAPCGASLKKVVEYANSCRVNVTIRQVD